MSIIENYQELAARTLIEKPDFEISDRDIMLVWNAIGLAGETSELIGLIHDLKQNGLFVSQASKLRGEIGDCFWYIAALCTKMNFDFAKIVDRVRWSMIGDISYACVVLAQKSGAIAEYVKKGVFHEHFRKQGLDEKAFEFLIEDYIHVLIGLCCLFNQDLDPILSGNIEKLKARYPDGFSSECSIKRVDGSTN